MGGAMMTYPTSHSAAGRTARMASRRNFAIPAIEVRTKVRLHHVDFAREEVDLAVRHGDGNWPGLDAVQLSAEQLFAVCSPKLLSGRRRLSRPADILKFPLIHLDRRADWTKWLRSAGIAEGGVTHGPVLNRASMVIDAAINGQGVALARTTLAAWDIINERLVRPFRFRCRRPIGLSIRRRRRPCPRSSRFVIGCWPRHLETCSN